MMAYIEVHDSIPKSVTIKEDNHKIFQKKKKKKNLKKKISFQKKKIKKEKNFKSRK